MKSSWTMVLLALAASAGDTARVKNEGKGEVGMQAQEESQDGLIAKPMAVEESEVEGSKDKTAVNSSPSAPAPTCISSDLYSFPTSTHPSGEQVYLAFSNKNCAGNLSKVMANAAVVEFFKIFALGNRTGNTPEVPPVVTKAFEPLCSDSCPKSLVECKNSNGRNCDDAEKTTYVGLFEYICTKAPSSPGPSPPSTDCDSSADLYTLPSNSSTEDVILLKFNGAACAGHLTTLLSSESLASAFKSVAQVTFGNIGLKADFAQVPAALVTGFTPFCSVNSGRCPSAYLQCKEAKTGEACIFNEKNSNGTESRTSFYVSLFSYICMLVEVEIGTPALIRNWYD